LRAQWEALHASLVQSVRTLECNTRFRQLSEARPVLRRFAEPVALLDYLCGTRGDLDNKDKVLAVLVRAAQARGALAKLAMSLLLLGLWPALDGIFRRNVHRFPGGPDELASDSSSTVPGCTAIGNRVDSITWAERERPRRRM